MEKREVMLYTITMFSFIAAVYLAFGTITKIPDIADERFMSLAGNIILDLEGNFKVGDVFKGNIIIISQKETNDTTYGIVLLTKDNAPILTETFNLKDFLIRDNSGKDFIKIEDLINHRFEEKGNYELLFSVLDLDINIEKEILVK